MQTWYIYLILTKGGIFFVLRFSDILRQHGVKVWLSNLVGSLAVGIVGAFIFVLFFLALMIVGGALLVGSLPSGISLDTMTGDEIIPMLDSFFSSGTLLILLLFLLIGGILYLLLEAFQNAGSISVAVQAVAENKSDISTYFSKGFKYMLKAFLVYLLSSLAYLVPGLLLLIGIIAAGMNSPVIGALLILIGLIGFFILGLAFMHAPYILISEDTDVILSLKKSFRLFTKAFGRVFGSFFFAMLLTVAIVVVYLLVSFVFVFLGNSGNQGVLAVMELIQFLLQIAITPFIMMIITLMIAYRYHKYLRPLIVNVEAEPAAPATDDADVSFSIKKSDPDSPSTERKDDE
jgi:hypothetical protein